MPKYFFLSFTYAKYHIAYQYVFRYFAKSFAAKRSRTEICIKVDCRQRRPLEICRLISKIIKCFISLQCKIRNAQKPSKIKAFGHIKTTKKLLPLYCCGGGLEVISYTTRLMPRTSFVILWEDLLSNYISDIEKQERNGIAKYANREFFPRDYALYL